MTIKSMQKQAEQDMKESFQDDDFNEDDESKSRSCRAVEGVDLEKIMKLY
jgi:hypothetical protein